jgi:AraC family transcriptional regulator
MQVATMPRPQSPIHLSNTMSPGASAPWSHSRRWATPAGAQQVALERRTWTRFDATLRALRCEQPLVLDLRADRPQLIFILEQVGGHLDIGINPEGNLRRRAPPHSAHFSIVPANTPAWMTADKVSFVRGVTLQFDLDTIEGEIDLDKAFAPRMMGTDGRLLHLATLIAEECTSNRLRDRVFEDSLTLALLSSLAHLPGPRKAALNRGGLAPWQLKRVHDFLLSNIGENLRLEQLADMTQLSLSHFCRSFKVATGLPPHQWILQERINKARELLLRPQARLADVAVETGFADQAHFTRAFGRAVGQSPGAWQRSRNM